MITEETALFIRKHVDDDIQSLALKAKRVPEVDLPFSLTQIEARQQIKEKLPNWYANFDLVFPQKIAGEQCSSEATARYKQPLLRGESLMDLTGGLGVDSYYFAQKTLHSIYIEQNPAFHQAAVHNFKSWGVAHIDLIHADAQSYLVSAPLVDTIFIDPARRDSSNRRLFSLAETMPNVIDMLPELEKHCKRLIIKASTMADISSTIKELKCVSEVHILAHKGECKELLFVCDFDRTTTEIRFIAANIQSNGSYIPFEFTQQEESRAEVIYENQPEGYLYEPDASILKAGAFRLIAARYGLRKMAPNSHLYSSTEAIDPFPGRRFKIIETAPFSSANNKRLFSTYKQANLTVRNFPLTVAELRNKWRLKEGGDRYLFATTCADQSKLIIYTEKG